MKILFLSINMNSLIMPTLPIGAVCVASAVKATGRHIVKIAALPSDESFKKTFSP